MNSLDYRFECLDGYYQIHLCLDKNVGFVVETSIDGLINKQGNFDFSLIENKLNDLKIEKWDKTYNAYLSSIEDATTWNLTYLKNNIVYNSSGEESYEPYQYNDLIDLICLIDAQASYLKFITI